MTGFKILYLVIAMSCVFISPGEASKKNSDVDDKATEYNLNFPTCAPESACGMLQMNVRGLSKKPLCKCTKSTCPMNWDEKDGFSVTQGSHQYKFCDPAPKLRPCDTTQVAFTGRLQKSRFTKNQIKSDRLHCICPARRTYHLISSDLPPWDPVNEYREWKYVCAPFNKCIAGSVCKTLVEDGTEFLVKKECNCPEGLRCPSSTKNAIRRPNYWGKESLYDVYCQKKKKRNLVPKKVCIKFFWQRFL